MTLTRGLLQRNNVRISAMPRLAFVLVATLENLIEKGIITGRGCVLLQSPQPILMAPLNRSMEESTLAVLDAKLRHVLPPRPRPSEKTLRAGFKRQE